MQQWIPRTQTLEPKIWGQVGLRQGLHIGMGVFAGVFFLIALAPFGIGPRIAAALLALAAGSAAGFSAAGGSTSAGGPDQIGSRGQTERRPSTSRPVWPELLCACSWRDGDYYRLSGR